MIFWEMIVFDKVSFWKWKRTITFSQRRYVIYIQGFARREV